MKYLIIFLLSLATYSSLSQTSFNLKLGGNLPIAYNNYNVHREFGAELGLSLHHEFSGPIGLEYGILTDAFGRINSLPEIEDDTRYLTLSFFVPLLATYSFTNTKFVIKGGAMPSLKNAVTFSRYSGISAGGLGSPFPSFPTIRHLAVDGMLEVGYGLTSHLYVYTAYKTPLVNNKDHFGVVSFGMQYSLF